ncbi:MAG: SH3 domain-containing protein [Bauldia sp.]
MRAKFICLVGFLLMALASPLSVARADFMLFGGTSGVAFSTSCPANQYVAGFFGHVGSWLDNIGLTCAPAIGNTGFGAAVQTPQFFGGMGGGVTRSQCDAGTAARHLHYFVQYNDADYDSLQYIRGISYDCARADGTPASNKCFGVCHDGDHSATFVPGSPDVDNNCAPGLVTGLTGKSGQYVVALGALCGPLPAVVAANTPPPKPIKTTGKPVGGGVSSAPLANDQVLICQGGGMTVAPISGSSTSMLVNFVAAPQGANVAQPAPGQCAWSTGPIESVWKKLGVASTQPMGQQLLQAAQQGGSFILEARTLGAGIVYVDRIDSVQLASASGTAAVASADKTTPPAGSGYVLDCQGGKGMRISGGGAVIGGPSFFSVSFKAADQPGNSGALEPGTCAWVDRPLNAAEPLLLNIPNDLQGADSLKQALKRGSFAVHANNEGKDLLVNQIDDVQGGGNAQGGGVSVNVTVGNGGGSGGGSVLQPPIAEDNGSGQPATIAKAVNVHTTAGGKQDSVLGSLSAGTSVTSLGCSKGWCQIQFPGGEGYVGQSFLGPQ